MDQRLKGKRAVVTGATRGIGHAISRRLLQEGASVILCSRSREDSEKVADELSAATGGTAKGFPADVSKRDDVEKLFQFATSEFAGLDILINNAGVGIFKSVAELTPDEWDRLIGINLSGTFYCSRAALPALIESGDGFIVNISSLAGKNPFAGGAAYNASKFGMNGFSEAMMMDHRHDNIRVSYVMPGSVDTGFTAGGSGASWKIASEDVAEIVAMVLTLPKRTLVSRVEVRPSQPPRKG